MDEIESRVDSKFRYVLLAAQRAEQLIRGANARVSLRSSKVARVAMEELLENRIEWGYGPPPQPEATETGPASNGAEGAGSAGTV
jgi:DNA-directed RNA polymerase subunit omega